MKLNTDTYYELDRLKKKLEQLPGVSDVVFNGSDEILLITKKRRKLIDVMDILKVKSLVINMVLYVRFTDINNLLSLGQKIKEDGQDETHIIGESESEDEEDEEDDKKKK